MNFLRLQGNGTLESNRRKTTENISVLVDKNTYYIVYYRLLRYQQAAVAQVVAHLIGSEEVTSSTLVASLKKADTLRESVEYLPFISIICDWLAWNNYSSDNRLRTA